MTIPTLPPLSLFQGNTRAIRFQVTDQDGAVYDLTGWSFKITFDSRQGNRI